MVIDVTEDKISMFDIIDNWCREKQIIKENLKEEILGLRVFILLIPLNRMDKCLYIDSPKRVFIQEVVS